MPRRKPEPDDLYFDETGLLKAKRKPKPIDADDYEGELRIEDSFDADWEPGKGIPKSKRSSAASEAERRHLELEISSLEHSIERTKDDYDACKDDLAKHKAKVKTLDAIIEKRTTEIANLKANIVTINKANASYVRENKTLRAQLDLGTIHSPRRPGIEL